MRTASDPFIGVNLRRARFDPFARRVILLALVGLLFSAVATASTESEFWFVEANEGQSAGGHAALRLGSRVYHLEHRGDGLIADRRTSPRRFLEVYADRGNRRIEAIPLALTAEQTRSLEILLAERYADRTQKLAVLDALDDEIRWLQSVEKTGALSVAIPGLGLFTQGTKRSGCEEDAAFAGRSLESLVRIEEAKRRTHTQLVRILEGTDGAALLARKPIAPGGRFRRLMQAARTQFALEFLLGCQGALRPEALIATRTPLRSADRARWLGAQDQLSEEIKALLESPRTDIGLPLLLASARRAAVRQTLSTQQIHLLAPFEENPAKVARSFTRSTTSVVGEVPGPWRSLRRQETAGQWTRALADFAAGDGPLEARLFRLERTHHRLRHLEGDTLHDPVRPESRSPSSAEAYASGFLTLPWPLGTRFSAVRETRGELEKAATTLRQSLEEELRYGLFTRNCVSELSVALQSVQTDESNRNPQFRNRHGRLSPVEILRGAFIPEVVALRVERVLGRTPRRMLPSTRERALERARGESRSPVSRLAFEAREFVTLTSQTYRPNQDDSRFLFFSDAPTLMRPLIGIANLGYGFAASAFGLFEVPFDRGIGLRRGLQGIAMSVPELFFFQVRQGSYRVAPPFALAPSAGSTDTR